MENFKDKIIYKKRGLKESKQIEKELDKDEKIHKSSMKAEKIQKENILNAEGVDPEAIEEE